MQRTAIAPCAERRTDLHFQPTRLFQRTHLLLKVANTSPSTGHLRIERNNSVPDAGHSYSSSGSMRLKARCSRWERSMTILRSSQVGTYLLEVRRHGINPIIHFLRITSIREWAMSKVNCAVRPNHSFNRKQWGMPSFGPPFHYGPNAVIPHCSG